MTNPYAVESTQRVEPELATEGRRVARELAAGGAAVGSIAKKLRVMGIDESNSVLIASDAIVAQSRKERLQGFMLTAAGLLLLIGAYLLMDWFAMRIITHRIPIIIALAGAFLILLGLKQVFHRSKLRRNGPRNERFD